MEEHKGYRMFAVAYLVTFCVAPLTDLLWQWHWGWIKFNWVLYPVFLASLIISAWRARRMPHTMLLVLGVAAMYSLVFVAGSGHWINLVRLILALLPLLFINELRANISDEWFAKCWKIYPIVLLVPLLICFLQVVGTIPYYDSGIAYDLYPGRISGGYMKPNNLNAILFPAFLYGLYLYYKGEKTKGIIIAGVIYLVVVLSGLRTSVIAYSLILLLAPFPQESRMLIGKAFKYGIFFIVGISSFFLLGLGRESIGIQDGFRQRLPMWMVQSEYFFHSSPVEIALGKGDVQLPDEARHYGVASLTEVHNNDFRLMITFGLVGYILYSLLLRKVAGSISRSDYSEQLKFLQSACLIHVVVYGVTNEPAFYAGIFWPLIMWIFFTTDLPNKGSKG